MLGGSILQVSTTLQYSTLLCILLFRNAVLCTYVLLITLRLFPHNYNSFSQQKRTNSSDTIPFFHSFNLNHSYSRRSIRSMCDTSVCGALQCERSEQICSVGRSGCVSSAGYVLPKQIHLSGVLDPPPPSSSSFSAFTPTLVPPLSTTSSYRFYTQQNGAVDLFASQPTLPGYRHEITHSYPILI